MAHISALTIRVGCKHPTKNMRDDNENKSAIGIRVRSQGRKI